MVAGGLSAATTLLGMLLLGLFGLAILTDVDAREALPGVGVWMGLGLVSLALSALVIYAGLQMRQYRNWGLSMAGAVAAMLPCAPCCILGLPMGIWALIVLIDDEVKQAFNGGPPTGYGDPPGGYGGHGGPPGSYGAPPGSHGAPPGSYGGQSGGHGGPPTS